MLNGVLLYHKANQKGYIIANVISIVTQIHKILD